MRRGINPRGRRTPGNAPDAAAASRSGAGRQRPPVDGAGKAAQSAGANNPPFPRESAALDLSLTLRSGLFWSGSAAFVLIGAAAALYGPSLPGFGRAFGVTPAEAGLVISAHALGGLAGLVMSVIFGSVTARAALVILAAGAGLIALSLAFWTTVLGALVLGAGYALVSAVMNRRLLTESGPNGPAMLGLVNAIFGIGAILGPLLLIATGGVPAIAFAIVALGFICLAPVAGGRGTPAGPEGLAAAGGLMRNPAILILGAAAVGFEVTLIGLGPTALVARGLSEVRAAELASLFFGFFLAGRFALVWIAARIPALMLMAGGFAVGGGLFAAASVLPPAAYFAVTGASVGILFPSYFVAASGILGTEGRAAALIMAAGYIGAVVLPALASGAIALFGGAVLFPLGALFGAGAAAGSLFLARRR
jgi:fucose permease